MTIGNIKIRLDAIDTFMLLIMPVISDFIPDIQQDEDKCARPIESPRILRKV